MVCNYKFSSRLSAAVSISNNWLENVPVFKIAGLFASNCLILAHPKHCYTVMPKMTATIGSTLRFQEKKTTEKKCSNIAEFFYFSYYLKNISQGCALCIRALTTPPLNVNTSLPSYVAQEPFCALDHRICKKKSFKNVQIELDLFYRGM